MQRKSLLPMLLTTMVLLIGGLVTVRHEFPSPPPQRFQAARDRLERKATATERQAGIRSIVSQLDAFRKDDYNTAVTFQSSGLKQKFASTAMFRTMMKKQYPEFAAYKSVVFGVATADRNGRHLFIPVKLTGRDGVTVVAAYDLVLEENVYRIEGVPGGVAPGPAKPSTGGPAKPNAAPPQPPPVAA